VPVRAGPQPDRTDWGMSSAGRLGPEMRATHQRNFGEYFRSTDTQGTQDNPQD